MQSIDNALEKLSKSKFRSSFHLKAKDIAYIDEKGMDTVRRHAEDFIEKKLAPAYPENDGKQTPNEKSSRLYCPARLRLLLQGLP